MLLPDEELEKFIGDLKATGYLEKVQDADLWNLYAESARLIRKFLEFRLDFHASFATSTEFASSFREAMLKAHTKQAPKYSGHMESLLTQSDNVRFAKINPPNEERKAFLNNLEMLFKAFPATSTREEGAL